AGGATGETGGGPPAEATLPGAGGGATFGATLARSTALAGSSSFTDRGAAAGAPGPGLACTSCASWTARFVAPSRYSRAALACSCRTSGATFCSFTFLLLLCTWLIGVSMATWLTDLLLNTLVVALLTTVVLLLITVVLLTMLLTTTFCCTSVRGGRATSPR